MNDEQTVAHGRCLCGAIRFELSGPPKWVVHCHCESCRRATGAAFATYAGYETAQLSLKQGAPATHSSSPGVTRSFCATCGTSLFFEGQRWPGEVHVHAGAFDDPGSLEPKVHVYIAEKMPWLHLDDGLPSFETTASAG